MIEDKDFIGNFYKQNCGCILQVIKKTEIQNSCRQFLYEIEFKNPYFKGNYPKHQILNGQVNNPLYDEIIGKVYKGLDDSWKVLSKGKFQKGRQYYLCESLNYNNTKEFLKINLQRGEISNREYIENKNFIGKTFHQKCGLDIKVLEKTNIKAKGNQTYYRYEKLSPYFGEGLALKTNILNGRVSNEKEKDEKCFVNKVFLQKNGYSLKVLQKLDEKYYGSVLFLCEFLGDFPCKVKSTKNLIQSGRVSNPILPYRNKNLLESYLKKQNQKVTLNELSCFLNITKSCISSKINKWNLREYIDYSYSYEENLVRNKIEEILQDKTIIYEDSKYEIDIYIPKLKLGFDYNGSYWHSSKYKKENYHELKKEYFKEKGINLLYIWDYDIFLKHKNEYIFNENYLNSLKNILEDTTKAL